MLERVKILFKKRLRIPELSVVSVRRLWLSGDPGGRGWMMKFEIFFFAFLVIEIFLKFKRRKKWEEKKGAKGGGGAGLLEGRS